MTRRSLDIATLMSRSGVKFGTSGARGLVADMTDAVCHAFATAFLRAVAPEAPVVVIGHDLRPSSPGIAAACAAAVRDEGRRIVYAGALPTPALAHHGARIGAPVIVITGSHIPFDRNGIKFYGTDGEITKDDEQRMAATVVELQTHPRLETLGPPDPAARESYVARYVDFLGAGALDGTVVAVHEHSSVARDVLPEILERLGARVLRGGRTDTFVPIDTEAVRDEDVALARERASRERFDAIVSTDGDADRPLIGDESGSWLRGDAVGTLCARWLGVDVVVTPVSSNSAVERCGAFGRVVRTRIGSPHVIAGMRMAAAAGRTVGVAGYEANGGFLLGSAAERAGRRLEALETRDAVLPILALLCAARERRAPLSALVATLPARHTASDRLQAFPSADGAALVARLAADRPALGALLAPACGPVVAVDLTDGVRATFASGDIVHLRPSGNAPELRCYAEADSAEHAARLCGEALARVAAGGGAADTTPPGGTDRRHAETMA
ncbi:MAG: hypothetical protein RJA99_1659 [Pseudomonadota bacterium]|jgi:phosphomannomutase